MKEDDNVKPDAVIIPEEQFTHEEERGGPIFIPQLYLQRYFYVQQELQKYNVRSIVDFGSAECKISKYLVRIPSVENVALVDIDGDLLESNKHNIQPLISDYIRCRNNSLTVQVYQGSVTNLDEAICSYDAVSMVEIIEHLYPDILDAACEMVFGHLKPRVAIVTTPNADYNQLFPNFSGFRHWDHKFEWTQKEFKDWAEGISQTFHYDVKYSGVGDPPSGLEHLGFCSQIAVFTRHTSQCPSLTSSPATQTYKLIAMCKYPHRQMEELSETDSLLQEVDYLIRQMGRGTPSNLCEVESEEDDVKCVVPISYFLKFEKFHKYKSAEDQFRLFLQNHGYRISLDGQSVIVLEDPFSDSDGSCDDGANNNPPQYKDITEYGALDQTDLNSHSKCEQRILCDSGVAVDQEGECENWE